jgi:hypothetical protein
MIFVGSMSYFIVYSLLIVILLLFLFELIYIYSKVIYDKFISARKISLKRNGTVEFCIDLSKSYYFGDEVISKYDHALLHPVTLLQHNINVSSVWYKFETVINTLLFPLYMKFEFNNPWRKRKIDLKCIIEIEEVIEFCREREISVSFNITGIKNKYNYEIDGIDRLMNVIKEK